MKAFDRSHKSVSAFLWCALALLFMVCGAVAAVAQADPLPSWNAGPAKQAVLNFVSDTTTQSSPNYVPPEDRFATFDQDGTTWVEHEIYSQVAFAFERVVALAPQHPEWKTIAPFKSVIVGDRAAMERFTAKDLITIFVATHTGMSVEAFQTIAKDWLD